jgi:hypothetical protein
MLAQSNELARPMLLPMHSLPLRFTDRKGRIRYSAVFQLEAVIYGFTAVKHPATNGLLYYEGGDVNSAGAAIPASR